MITCLLEELFKQEARLMSELKPVLTGIFKTFFKNDIFLVIKDERTIIKSYSFSILGFHEKNLNIFRVDHPCQTGE